MVLGTHQPLGGEVGDQVLGGSSVDAVSLRKHVQLKQNTPINQEDATPLIFAILYLHIIYKTSTMSVKVYTIGYHCFTVQ